MALHTGATLARLVAAFCRGMGSARRWGCIKGLTDGWLVGRAVPEPASAGVIVLACLWLWLWLGLIEVAAILAISAEKAAVVFGIIREGVRARDTAIDDMAQVYRMSGWSRFRHALLVQTAQARGALAGRRRIVSFSLRGMVRAL